jgi:hypothetical protein
LILTGTSPAQKMKIANEVRRWTGVVVNNFNQVDWTQDINITGLIEPKFKEFNINKKLSVNGINCHGTSFYISGFLKRLSYVGMNEMNFYLNNYCKRVSGPEANAIGVINRKTMLSHSFKVIGPNIIFQKKSISKKDPFKFYLINDYKTSEFFRCQPVLKDNCPTQHLQLKSEVSKLDIIYNRILQHNLDAEFREVAYSSIEPLASRVHIAINNESNPYCQQDLLRLKYRLESLEDVGHNILGDGLYGEPGKLIYIEPKI